MVCVNKRKIEGVHNPKMIDIENKRMCQPRTIYCLSGSIVYLPCAYCPVNSTRSYFLMIQKKFVKE